jgi:tRNA-modifying protein YgfZ
MIQTKQFATHMIPTQSIDDNNTDLDAQLAQSILVEINCTGVLTVSGEDALRFLQGQTTCDMRDVSHTHSTLGAFCTPKGRVFANFRAFKIADTFYLHMDKSIVESTRLALDKYIRFFKALMTNESKQWTCFGVAGIQAEEVLKTVFTNIPEAINAVIEIKSGMIIRLPNTQPRFEVWLNDVATADEYRQLLSTELKIASPSIWNLLNIRAGLAYITIETVEAFTPHMINYQAVGGISFTKGCYTGQEIVARTHYLGKLKKHLYRLSVNTTELPITGSAVIQNGQPVGEVVNAVMVNANTVELLAVIQQQSIETGGLSINGQEATILTLPYSLESE